METSQMSWFTTKHDTITISVIALVFASATLANFWDELGFLGLAPFLILAPLGLLPAWFLWAWTILDKGYFPSLSPILALALGSVFGSLLFAFVLKMARLEVVPDPKVLIFVSLCVLFGAAFLLPPRKTTR